jgi:hypothetical protein
MCKNLFKDSFGFNNPILQIPENFLKNPALKEKRQRMVDDFQNILFTSLKKRVQLSEEQNKKKTTKAAKTEESNFANF